MGDARHAVRCAGMFLMLLAAQSEADGICPDGWSKVGESRGLVTCKRSASNPGTCGETAVFSDGYDRCGWARQCHARWDDCGKPINGFPEVPVVARSQHDFGRYLKLVDGRATVDERGVLELLSADRGPVQYTQFNGTRVTLYPWYGNHVVYLTPNRNLDKKAMYVLLAYSDRAWEAFSDLTGGTPGAYGRTTLSGRAIIAVVPQSSCGMGCGQIGSNGIEKTESIWSFKTHRIEEKVANGEPFQLGFLTFYELGRNFAILNRWLVLPGEDAMGSGKLAIEAFKMLAYPYVTDHIRVPVIASGTLAVHQAGLAKVLGDYQSTPALTAENTLLLGKSHDGKTPPNDLLCSILHDLAKRHGGYLFVKRLFHAIREGEVPKTPQDVLDQYFVAASRAAKVDLGPTFVSQYRWHPSAAARARAARVEAGGRPVP